jgi:hypothetical protein
MKKYNTHSCVFKMKNIAAIFLFFIVCSVASFAQPLVANAGTSSTICQGSAITIGGSPTASYGSPPYTYSWSPATGLSATTIANPTASPTSTVTYTVTVTDAVSSTSFSTVTITVNPLPTVTVNSPTICQGSSAVLTAAGATTYSWSPPTGLSTTSGSSPTANPTVTTTYTVAGTSSGGCTATATSTVTVNPIPAAPAASSNSPVCDGSTLNLSASFATGATYSWTGPSGFSSTLQNPTISTVSSANAGVYSVTKTLAGCTSPAATVNVTVNPNPTVNAGADITVCFGSPVTFTATAPGAISYSWNFGDGGSATVLNPSYTYGTAGLYSATLTVTGSTGCTASDAVLVTNSQPVLTTTSLMNASCNGICDGSATVSASGGSGSYIYNWTPSVSTLPTASSLCAGSYTVTTTDGAGCTGSMILSITQPTAISLSSSSTPITCFGGCDATASVTATGGTPSYTYLWTPVGVTTAFVSGLCAGSYTVTVTDANGCNSSDIVTLTNPTTISVVTSLPDTICIGSSSVIYATAIGGSSPYIYSWFDGVTNFSTTDTNIVSPLVNTLYTATITDANGCSGNGSTSVVIGNNADIDGHITYSGGTLTSGTNIAFLFQYTSGFIGFDTVQSTPVDASGNYHFASIYPGDYLVKVFPDTMVYPGMVPTYYGDVYLWDSASVITHDCFATTIADILMVEGVTGVGPGMISGHIGEGAGFGRTPGDPVPGIDIKLGRNPGGQLVTSTQTDSNGDYAFTNLPLNSAGEYYTIYVDIPGLERDSTYNVTITSTNTDFPNLNYTADSSSVYPDQTSVGIHSGSVSQNDIKLYPNPAKDQVVIEYSTGSDSHVSLSIYNIIGLKIAQIDNKKQLAGTYKLNLNIANYNLSSGVYLVIFEMEGTKKTQRLVITE